MDNRTLIKEWQNWLKAGSVSPKSIQLYSRYVNKFAETVDLSTAESVDIIKWMNSHSNWMPETRRSARSAVRSFYMWMLEYDYRIDNPALKTRAIKLAPRVPKIASDNDFEYALSRANERDRLAILLAGYAGMRRAEIAGLHAKDIEDEYLRIKGKGGKIRIIPLHPVLEEVLQDFRGRDEYIFTDHNTGEPLSPEAMGKRISRLLPPGISAHKLRHRFATKIYKNTHDLRSLQTILGHQSISTTERYVAVDNDALFKVVMTL
jgi:integrase/recombinase XerC